MPENRRLGTPENSSNSANITQAIYSQYTEEIYKNNGKIPVLVDGKKLTNNYSIIIM